MNGLNASTFVVLATVVALGACAPAAKKSTEQTILGRLDAASFTSVPTVVRAITATKEIRAKVGDDGAFKLKIPAAVKAQLRFDTNRSGIVYPRKAGTIDFSFVTGRGTFDLGAVQHIGDAAGHSYAFSANNTGGAGSIAVDDDGCDGENNDDDGEHDDGEANDDSGDSGDSGDTADGDGECENGVDQNGAACVNPTDDGGDDGDSGDTADGDGECENGVDPSGSPCVDDGEDGSDSGESNDDDGADTAPSDAAVPDHNPPADLSSCDAEGDDGEHDDDGEHED